MSDKSLEQAPAEIRSNAELESNVLDIKGVVNAADHFKKVRIGPEMRNKVLEEVFK